MAEVGFRRRRNRDELTGDGVAILEARRADLAWGNSLLLWQLRDNSFARGLFLDNLAASVALASRLLLVAV